MAKKKKFKHAMKFYMGNTPNENVEFDFTPTVSSILFQ